MILDLPAAPVSGDATSQSEWRNAVRRALLGWRAGLDAATHHHLSGKILDHFTRFLADHPKATVGFYWPIQNEIDVRPVIEAHIASGGRAALPVVPGKDQPMVFHAWTPDTEMVPGFARIPEPKGTELVAVDILLAPLVGFDGQGYRLGYGGGFFDRTLAACEPKPLVIGIGFEATRLKDILPHQYDVPVDVLITDQGMTKVA
ncbi:5-formyltetrahydrofolate cyclo-ligase [Thalassospira sp.]|uniref:5-formyltetrahydrofolate cyclo-ligase n=1 Tax=Thalassospira sp. TaxID=1912094 RepID=UPI000C391EF4|nr:5-formyltetrahydrofolate cyclo-ligase [Thalassospira sp.]MBC07402.1 5-formyltetrahydrofolate cyclo-ligase [Thalassospira sp.]|tara:strand:- start:687 stop:1295 length:609 start_codon:yes stop_codon:yes gene_type:complete